MAQLPSGTQFCVDSLPLDRLLHQIKKGSAPHIADLILIQESTDLRPHLRLLWLLPLGADCPVISEFHPLSPPMAEGLTVIDSGYRFDQALAQLDEQDQHALNLFWESARCQAFIAELMVKVRDLQIWVYRMH
jgi:hypothetical protein